MAKNLYPSAKALFLGGDLDWDAHNFKLSLVTSAYTYSSAHDFRNDTTGVIATSGNLASKTKVAGVADAADVTISAVAAGSTIVGYFIYRDVGTSATDPLICFVSEQPNGDPISVPTNGSDITVTFDAAGIFEL